MIRPRRTWSRWRSTAQIWWTWGQGVPWVPELPTYAFCSGSASAQNSRTSRRPWRAFGAASRNQLMRPPRSASSRWSQRGGVWTPVGRPSGRRSTCIQGGKGRRGVLEQRVLVPIDREEVVAVSRDDLLRDVPLREQGICRHDPPRQRHRPEQRLRGGDLMPLAHRPNLAEHQPGGVRVGRHQIGAGHALRLVLTLRLAASQHFPVEGDRLWPPPGPGLRLCWAPQPPEPRSQRSLECRHVHLLVQAMERRDTRAAPGRQPQRLQQPGIIVQPFTSPLRYRRLAPRPAQQRRHPQLERRDQRDRLVTRPPSIRPSRVRYPRQRLGQRSRRWRIDNRQRLPLPKHPATPPRLLTTYTTPSPRLVKRPWLGLDQL